MQTATDNVITLKGSTAIVTEFFNYCVNNILYQRGIYPPESFRKVAFYGLSMMVTTDDSLLLYLSNILKQLEVWLNSRAAQKLVLVVKGIDSGATLERWVFDCECKEKDMSKDASEIMDKKSQKEITTEIQAIIRQITSSVTFLPLLDESCCFDLLVYADKEATVPVTWEDTDPCFIPNSESVQLRSFSTKVHNVNVKVSYRADDDDA